MRNRLHLDPRDSQLYLLTLITPECVVSCQSGGSCFSLFAQGPSLFTGYVASCHLAYVPPLSAHFYLPVLTE